MAVIAVAGGKLIKLLTFTVMLREIRDELDAFCHFVLCYINHGVVIAASVIITIQIL